MAQEKPKNAVAPIIRIEFKKPRGCIVDIHTKDIEKTYVQTHMIRHTLSQEGTL